MFFDMQNTHRRLTRHAIPIAVFPSFKWNLAARLGSNSEAAAPGRRPDNVLPLTTNQPSRRHEEPVANRRPVIIVFDGKRTARPPFSTERSRPSLERRFVGSISATQGVTHRGFRCVDVERQCQFLAVKPPHSLGPDR